ncbi:MAG TPA: NAD(P)-dependent oxidoreductase [Gemmatimonadales bacterium]|jgi:3-hydroxyisobutyrate dehydrogenase-like beta-hydroxyacid dehydrogenase
MPSLAFLGLGAMGIPMARNLLQAGFEVRVWNRTASKTRDVSGARSAPTPAQACDGADFAVSMLADDAAVETSVLGSDGALAGLGAGSIHVASSTISVALCRRLVEAHAAKGVGYVAAPVFGRPDAAAAKQLWIVPGGAPSDIERCAPVFSALGQGTFLMGTAPQATLAKLLGNFMIASTIEMLGESLAAAEKAGLEPTRVLDMLTGTLFGAPVFRRYGQLLANTTFEPAGFCLPLGLKDVNLALNAAEELRVPLPLASLVRERMLTALALGREHFDWSGFASVIREAAGLAPVREPR